MNNWAGARVPRVGGGGVEGGGGGLSSTSDVTRMIP